MDKNRVFDLEDRLVDFSVRVITISESLPRTAAGVYITDQIVRSGTAPALNYGEAQAAESRADFVHKMKVSLKELRETRTSLKIIRRKNWVTGQEQENLMDENNQLIAIFVSSIETAKRNMAEAKKKLKS